MQNKIQLTFSDPEVEILRNQYLDDCRKEEKIKTFNMWLKDIIIEAKKI